MPIAWMDGSFVYPDFNDFNFSAPPQATSVAHQELAQWVCQARDGNKWAIRQFASAMYWTLRPTAFEAYLRLHPGVPISYPDWFYSKVHQFCRVLLDSDPGTPFTERAQRGIPIPDYSDAWLERDRLPETLQPDDNERLPWHEFVRTVSEQPEDRKGALWAWLKGQRQTPSTRKESPDTARRNNLIRQAHAKGQRGRQICEILDRNGVPTSDKMQEADVRTWTIAWDDPDFRNNVQQVISKAKKPVNT